MSRRTALVLLALAVLLAALYAAAGFLLLPYLVERHAPAQAAERLDAELSVGEARFNPFLLRLELEDVALAREPGRPLLALERLVADLEWASLWRRAWLVSALRLERPRVHMGFDAQGRLDWAGLLREPPQAGGGAPPAFFIERALLEHGSLELATAGGAQPAVANLADVLVEAEGLTNRPGQAGSYRASAALPEQGRLSAQGSLALAPAPQSRGDLALEGVRLAAFWPLLRERLGFETFAREANGRARYAFEARAGGAPALRLEAAELRFAEVALRPLGAPADAALLRLAALAGSGGRFDLAAREFGFEQVSLGQGRLALNWNADGVLDWQALGGPSDEPAQRAPAAPGRPWRASTPALKVAGVALQAADHARAVPLALDIASIDGSTGLALTFGGGGPTRTQLDALAATLGTPRLARADRRQTPLLRLDTLRLEGGALDSGARRLELEQVLARGGEAELVFEPAGRLGLIDALGGGRAANGGEANAGRAEDGEARTGEANTGGAKPDEATAGEAEAGDARTGEPEAGEAQAGQAEGRAKRGDGQPGPAEPGWHYRIAGLRAEGVALALSHRGSTPAVDYRAELAPATLGPIANADDAAPMRLDALLRLAGGGTLTAEATIAAGFADAEGSLRIDALPLLPLQPALAEQARLELRTGTLSADTRLTLRSEAAGRALRLEGSARIDGLRVDEAGTRDRFLAWRRLTAEGLRLDTAPGRLAIREIELLEPGAKLLIFKDRSVNLTQVLKRDGKDRPAAAGRPDGRTAAAAEPERAPRERAGSADASATPPFEVAIEGIRIREGVLDYADLSLVLPFSTQITRLSGSVINISTAKRERARVQASGEIQRFGAARVAGSLLPFEPTQFLDLRVRMSNVAMPPLSPYTATFAGRKVAEGRLWLELDYHIENGQLLGENRIRLADFRLGERVEAPDALDLPLDLAVALLTDEQGRIDIAVPVRGNVGDPSFDMGTVVREAIGSFLKRIVSAPFRALGKLFGGEGEEQLPVIEFVPGSAALMPPQREKLHKLGAAIAQRPRLELVVPASYAPGRDSRALRRREARRELARLLGDDPAPDERPGLIAYESERTQRALETLLAKVAGEDALRELRAARGATPAEPGGGGRKADPDAASQPSAAAVPGGFPTRHLRPGARDAAAPDGVRGQAPKPAARSDAAPGHAGAEDFYRAVFDRIVARYPIADAAVQLLATRRADAIRDYLIGDAGAPPERVRTGRLESVEGEERLVSTRLQLDASAQEPTRRPHAGGVSPAEPL